MLIERQMQKEKLSKETAQQNVDAYRAWLSELAQQGALAKDLIPPCILYPSACPTKHMLEMHILFTTEYRRFSQKLVGKYMHYTPSSTYKEGKAVAPAAPNAE